MAAFFRKKYFIGIVIIVAALIIAATLVFFALKDRPNDVALALPNIAAPDGWYAHHLDTVSPTSFLIFTRNPVLPARNATELGAYGEQIDVDISTTTYSPVDYIAREGFFDDPAGQVFDSGWSTLSDRPLFTIRGEGAEGEMFKAEFLFASGTVYEFDLDPDNAKDYGDLQKIVNEIAGELR